MNITKRSILLAGLTMFFFLAPALAELNRAAEPHNDIYQKEQSAEDRDIALQTSRVGRDIDTINVEVDYMVGDDHTHELLQPEIDAIVDMFACQGIVINIEISDALPHVDVIGNDEGDVFGNMTPNTGFAWIKQNYCDHLGEPGWHYCIMAHLYDIGYGTGSSGLSELLGDDFLVSLGGWWSLDEVGTPFDRAACFVHELGHNLGLRHAGDQDEGTVGPFKPNYASVMAYRYQLRGVRAAMMCEETTDTCSPFRNLDYSHGLLPPLDETALDETVGIGYGSVDWNCNGVIDQTPVTMDLNDYPSNDNGSYQTITDYDDWSNITDVTYTSHRIALDKAEVISCITYEEYSQDTKINTEYCGKVSVGPEPCTYPYTDTDGDGIGDDCDQCPGSEQNDEDGDGICGDVDNCPYTPNPDQADINNNGQGDACECPGPGRIYTGDAAGDWFGFQASNAGDFNGDGFDDLIVGAMRHTGNFPEYYAGSAYIFSGRTGELLFLINGEGEGTGLGCSVDGVGDVNLDGYADVIVGAYLTGSTGGLYAGRAYVFYGGALTNPDTVWATDADMILDGLAPGDYFGWDVAGIGDVDGELGPDLLIGATQEGNGTAHGAAYVYSGQTGALVYSFFGDASGSDFGYSVSPAGDFNNDGIDDFIIGDFTYSVKGRVFIYSGFDGSLMVTITGEADSDMLGYSVSSAGDVNNDGFADIIVGAPFNDSGESNGGAAYVYDGYGGPFPEDLTTESASMIFTGITEMAVFGYSVSGMHDISGDGVNELAVGEPQYPGYGFLPGAVHIYSGADGTELVTLFGETKNDMFGRWVCGTQSSTSPHTLDLIVGAYLNDAGGANAGRTYLYMFGDEDEDYVLDNCDNCPGVANTDQLDLNGDGIGDACQYKCGDANADGKVNVSDAVYIINYVFVGGNPPNPLKAGDANCDVSVNVSDAVWIINYVFVGGNLPCDLDGDSAWDC